MMEKEYPRLLVISHNLFDRTNNVGKTLQSLLNNWPKDKLFSLYFRNEKPGTFYCNSYYLLHDKDVIKSLVSLGLKKCGEIYDSTYKIAGTCSNMEQSMYSLGNKRKPIISMIRDTIWHFSPWRGKQLRNWLKEIDPERILFVPNDYVLAFDVMKYVKSVTNAKMVTYYMDDAFYYGQKTQGIDKIRRKKLLKEGYKAANFSEKLFTTCDFMSKEYSRMFDKECIPFGNCVEIVKNEVYEKNKEVVISYIGNLHSNRWKSIFDIGNVLDEINSEKNQKCRFHIYSASKLDNEVLELFSHADSILFHGAVSPEQVRDIQIKSDILVHVEAFDYKSKVSTRLSVSTKIFEYLSVGRPIFAYGPSDIASMQYLENTNASCNCYQKEHLKDKMIALINDSNLRNDLGRNGHNYAIRHCNVMIEQVRMENALIDM